MGNPHAVSPPTKRCADCGEIKSVAEFNKHHKSKDGLQVRCKPCNRRAVLAWQKKYPAKANAKGREWKRAHATSVKEYAKQYRATHSKERAEYGRFRWSRLSTLEKQKIWRRDDLWRKYRITVEDYDALLIAQSGRCAICGAPVTPSRALAVDHDHKTKRNRGLLCGHCNPLLHKLEADADWMNKAIQYLLKFQATPCVGESG